jgi:hypothetical protein
MRRGKTVGDADQQIDDLAPRPILGLRPLPQGPGVDEFRDEVLLAFDLPDVVDSQNVWMIQRRRHLRLALKPPASAQIQKVIGKEFDGDGPVQLRIDGAINDTHAAFAERRFDAIRTDLGAYLQKASR